VTRASQWTRISSDEEERQREGFAIELALRLQREVGHEIIGPYGMVMGTDTPGGGMVQEVTLFSPGPSIYGGTDQVQRNILGERVLGLPKEPGPAKDTPYKELLVNR